ncbi:MAG TPA: HAMP domain-containing sensor histidine kinase, partial [Coleofasciculaceae cyanobacterium]
AHELKTPLTSIRLVAETLQSRLQPPLKGWVDRLINETVRLSDLVQDLLDLSRLERGASHPLQVKPTDLIELIYSVWNSLEPLARKKQLSLEYSGPAHLVMQLDQPRIHRLLVNLLDNGIKYSPVRQPIRIQVSSKPIAPKEMSANPFSYPAVGHATRDVYLDVIDYGSGFPEKAMPYVFDRFYRADLSRARLSITDRTSAIPADSAVSSGSISSPSNGSADQPQEGQLQGGSGLGLAIARQIVEAHQGSIQARNHPDTGGAWLQVRLPWFL